jgi:hypothetical protein
LPITRKSALDLIEIYRIGWRSPVGRHKGQTATIEGNSARAFLGAVVEKSYNLRQWRAYGRTPAKYISLLFWLAAIGACVAFSVRVVALAKFAGMDSWYPMSHALDFLQHPSDKPLYQTLFFSDHVKFQYPPSALLFLDLGRRIGIATVAQYNAINALLLISTAFVFSFFTTQLFGTISYRGVTVPVGPLAFLLALRFYPDNLAFQIGQMQVGLGLIFLLACFALLNGRGWLAGCLIAIASAVKPQFLPLGLLALWRRDWRFFFGLLVASSVFLGAAIFLYGWSAHLDYLNVLQFLSRHGEVQHLNQSIGGILDRWLYHGPSLDRDPNSPMPQSAFPPYISTVYFSVILTSVVMFVWPFIIKLKGNDRISRLVAFCLAGALFTLASPIAWVHHFNVLLPAYAVAAKAVFDRWTDRRAYAWLTLLCFSLVLTGYPLVAANSATDGTHDLLQSHVFFGAMLLIIILSVETLTTPTSEKNPILSG